MHVLPSIRAAVAALLPGILLAAAAAPVTAAGADPLELSLSWRSDLLRNAGGTESGSTHVGQLDAALSLDTTGLFGQPLRGTLSGFYNDGEAFSARVGDIQIASNIEADDGGVRLNEAWLEQALPWGESSLLMGKYDLNGEFDVLDAALPFVNSAFGIGTDIGASGPNGPSIYPATGLALRLRVALSDDLSLKLVAADGLPGDLDRPGRTRVALDENQGALLVAELARRGPRSRVLAGYWRYTRQRLPLCADLAACDQGQGNDGLYLRGERVLHDGASGRRWQAFFRLGSAASAYNPLDRFVSAGLLATGLLPGRPDDQTGLAFAYGQVGSGLRQRLRDDGLSPAASEGAVEGFYRIAVTPELALQPLVMLITDPGGVIDDRPTWVLGLRVELSRAFGLAF